MAKEPIIIGSEGSDDARLARYRSQIGPQIDIKLMRLYLIKVAKR